MLAEYCRANGIRLLIAALPELHDISQYRFQTITDLVHEAAERYGAEFLDILPYVQDQRSSRLWVAPSDPHPNAFAHSLIARGLFEALELPSDIGSSLSCDRQAPCHP
jgi:lysophospholipase L1-like esterase